MPDNTLFIIMPHRYVDMANAEPGALLYGFPALSALFGLGDALQRTLAALPINATVDGCGIVSHGYDERMSGNGFDQRAIVSRRGLQSRGHANKVKKSGAISGASIDEAAVIGVEVSLIFKLTVGVDVTEEENSIALASVVHAFFRTATFAGGRLTNKEKNSTVWMINGNSTDCLHELLPGFALVGRNDLMKTHLDKVRDTKPNADALDAVLDAIGVRWSCTVDEAGQPHWEHNKPKGTGWIVPISIGYRPIGPLCKAGTVKGARSAVVPVQQVEPVYSLGEWISLHRTRTLDDIVWTKDHIKSQGNYIFSSNYQPIEQELTDD